eukprot:jgi/Botrbrau1/16521/Bobra.0280s0001.1
MCPSPLGAVLATTTVIAFRLARSAIFPSSRADVNAPPTATARWTRVSNVTSLLARVAALATTIVIVCKSSVQCRSIWGGKTNDIGILIWRSSFRDVRWDSIGLVRS